MKHFSLSFISALFISLFFCQNFQANAQQECMVGEVRLFAGNFAPRGWSECNGQLVAINSNSTLFSILGTTYGGDGRTSFGLPKLQGPTSGAVGTNTSSKQTKSIANGAAIAVSFTNKTTSKVDAYWIDFSGNPTFYGSIESGKTWSIQSGAKQLWRFMDGNKEVCDIVLKADQKEYNVQPNAAANNSASGGGQAMRYIICTEGMYPARH